MYWSLYRLLIVSDVKNEIRDAKIFEMKKSDAYASTISNQFELNIDHQTT